MALTEDPQGFFDAQRAIEDERRAQEAAAQKRQTKIELVRLAKEVLLENARNQPMDYSAITATEITSFAEELVQYIGD
jgi:hypothetical protein